MSIYSLILTNILWNIIILILQKRKLSIKRLKDLPRNTELEVAEWEFEARSFWRQSHHKLPVMPGHVLNYGISCPWPEKWGSWSSCLHNQSVVVIPWEVNEK